jgi:hypothetical protein
MPPSTEDPMRQQPATIDPVPALRSLIAALPDDRLSELVAQPAGLDCWW